MSRTRKPTTRWMPEQRTLHVEAPGCIVNIRSGLHDVEGRAVTSVEVLADQFPGDGWHLPDCPRLRGINVRVMEGAPAPEPAPTAPHAGERLIAAAAWVVRLFGTDDAEGKEQLHEEVRKLRSALADIRADLQGTSNC